MLPSEDPGRLQVFLDLRATVCLFAMRLAPQKCKMLLQDRIGSKPNPVLEK